MLIRVYYNCGLSRETGQSTIYRNAVLIYNPAARGLAGKRVRRIHHSIELLRTAGHVVTAVPTPGPGTAGEIAREQAARGADVILAAGGDGTINEVANGLIHSPVPLGILPGGTANVLGNEVGIGNDMEEAAGRLAEWVPRRIAVGLLHAAEEPPRYFLMMAGVGFDASIVNTVDPALKKKSGKLAYWVAGIREFFRLQQLVEVRSSESTFTCTFGLASRVRDYGGTVDLATSASLANEDFAVVAVRARRPIGYVRFLPAAFLGRLESHPKVTVLHTKRLEFRGPAGSTVYVQVDGEAAGRLPASIEIVPDALTLLVPPDFQG
ncbi:MAG: diacylglycerol kinase family protein [Bryobacteraceae bacterium]